MAKVAEVLRHYWQLVRLFNFEVFLICEDTFFNIAFSFGVCEIFCKL